MPVQNGTAGNDTLTGGALNDTLNGLGGNDSLTGGADLDILDGGAGNDILDGGTMNDILKGGAGNDIFVDSFGEDTMTGGTGNDVYNVDDLDDQVIELAGGGTDVISTKVNNLSLSSYDHVEVLTLGGVGNLSASGSDRSDVLGGNAGSNTLTGGVGNDTLNGGGGGDVLKGGAGNDTYAVNPGDQLFEEIGKGKDTAVAFATYALAAGQEIETLTLQIGFGAIDGTGNEFANTINGNESDNVLKGGEAADTLNGGAGNDQLNGQVGNDVMVGGKGDDLYFVDSAKDKLTEAAGQGTDTVSSSLAAFTLGATFEHLDLGLLGVNGSGNTLSNKISANDLENTLDGAGGNDTLIAGQGDDTLLGGAGNDELDGGLGDDSLVGGAGNDTLNGSVGVDTMVGGAGNDRYVMNSVDDVVTEAAGGGFDLVQTTADGFSLANNVENLTLLGSSDINGGGNSLSNYITGNGGENKLFGSDGNDTLDGALGVDSLFGSNGNDTFFVNDTAEIVGGELVGQGKDTVFASVTYQLAADEEIEVLTLTGTGDFGATGNKYANTISGNSGDNGIVAQGGNDTLNGGDGDDNLDGGAGDDVMNGGKGDDVFFVDSAKDKAIEAAGQGYDIVYVNGIYTLGANIEEGRLLGSGSKIVGNTTGNYLDGNSSANTLDGGAGNDEIVGNGGDDSLIGGAGNDSLEGGFGDDTMVGGAGNDVYEVDSLDDKVTEQAGGGTDLVRATVGGLVLAANVENLEIAGAASIGGMGNSLANLMTGNSGVNLLVGDTGNDTLNGGANADNLIGNKGDDTFIVDNAGDQVFEVAGEGKDTVRSSVTFNFDDTKSIEVVILDSASSIGSVGNNFNNIITMTGTGPATINGNDGNDTLTGGSNNDVLLGGGGNDVMVGGGGNDSLTGDADNDKLNGATGKDAMIGGKGDDLYFLAEIGDTVTELAGQGTDIVLSRLVNYTLAANVENLVLDTGGINGTGNALGNLIIGNGVDNKLDGGSGADVLRGGNGNDSILGGLGFDYLDGGSGNDTLKGGGDVDYLEGGSGADVMYGEAGKDGFLYRIDDPAELATLGGDTINGFQTGVDRIELTDLLDEFGISAANAFSGGFVVLKDTGADTLVQFDQNGGANSLITLATVTNANVVAGDLMLDSQFIL
jgi:Ca2+-binding RTX toxin-like protein